MPHQLGLYTKETMMETPQPATRSELFGKFIEAHPIIIKQDVINATRQFAKSKPWQGDSGERIGKLQSFHIAVCEAADIATGLDIEERLYNGPHRTSTASKFDPQTNMIFIEGKLSVFTYVFLLSMAVNKREAEGSPVTLSWALKLFRLCFPKSFERSANDGSLLPGVSFTD